MYYTINYLTCQAFFKFIFLLVCPSRQASLRFVTLSVVVVFTLCTTNSTFVEMEQVTDLETASPAWKAGILAFILHLHIWYG